MQQEKRKKFFLLIICYIRNTIHAANDPGEFGESCLAYFWVLVWFVSIYQGSFDISYGN